MFEMIEGVCKGFGLLLRLFVEGGALDISLSGTGRFFIKLFYPPHWCTKMTYQCSLERVVGSIAWIIFSYGAYYFLDCV